MADATIDQGKLLEELLFYCALIKAQNSVILGNQFKILNKLTGMKGDEFDQDLSERINPAFKDEYNGALRRVQVESKTSGTA